VTTYQPKEFLVDGVAEKTTAWLAREDKAVVELAGLNEDLVAKHEARSPIIIAAEGFWNISMTTMPSSDRMGQTHIST
jgi:hypothetical protein